MHVPRPARTIARTITRTVTRTVRDRALLVASAIVVASALVAPSADAAPNRPKPSSGSSSLRELQATRERVRSTKARKASEIDVLKASDEEVGAALDRLAEDVSSQSSLLEDAQAAQAQAEADAAAAQAELDASQVALDGLKGNIKQEAIDAYLSTGQDRDWDILSAGDPADAVARSTFLEVRASRSQDSAEEYRTIQEDLALQRQARADAAARAKQKGNEATQRLADLDASTTRQEQIQADVDNRIDRALSEADALAAFDQSLSTEITNTQARLAAQLEAQRRAAASSRSRRGVLASAPPAGTARSFTTSGGSGIGSAAGISVANSIVGQVTALVQAARAAGINLAGSGYRDPAGQIAVRRNNCGSSNYAVYQAPASSCRPPTARPGSSQHELGLAIDFTENGRILNRSSSAFAWLKANAASYGMFNLPSEPWHWSTTGN